MMNDETRNIEYYQKLLTVIKGMKEDERLQTLRYLCRTDLFFLLWFGCGRKDMGRQWLIDRCHEVQKNPDGYLDLWSRDHYKSTIITFGKTIQDILASHGENPLKIWKGREVTFGIFSVTRPIAKTFLTQIKRELETNSLLKGLFPDILYEEPQKQAQKWSEDEGIIVKRKSNPKEATIEAWGLVEGQPTGRHFYIRVYDDVVTMDSCRSPEMIDKTTQSWEMSLNLGTRGGKSRHIGTRYHFNDTYRVIMERKAAIPRIHSCTVDGTAEGEPVLLTREELEEKRRFMGSYTFSSQMLLNPVADTSQGFQDKWLRFTDISSSENMNVYIVVDPANEKKKTSDFTVIEVIGLGSDNNYYTLDLVRDKLSLSERVDLLFRLHRKWRPISVGYEQYGMMSDISYIEERMNRENYRFHLVKVGGRLAKNDRIRRLIPIFEQGRWYLPYSLNYTNYEGRTEDLIKIFINNEYNVFPVSVHDDMLDAKARILEEDLNAVFPMSYDEERSLDAYAKERYTPVSAWGA